MFRGLVGALAGAAVVVGASQASAATTIMQATVQGVLTSSVGPSGLPGTYNHGPLNAGDWVNIILQYNTTGCGYGAQGDCEGGEGSPLPGSLTLVSAHIDIGGWTTTDTGYVYDSLSPGSLLIDDQIERLLITTPAPAGADLLTSYTATTGTGRLSVSTQRIDFDVTSFSIAPVPEPATWSMLIAGTAAIGVALRRRRPLAIGW